MKWFVFLFVEHHITFHAIIKFTGSCSRGHNCVSRFVPSSAFSARVTDAFDEVGSNMVHTSFASDESHLRLLRMEPA
eukprot:5751407-Pyramimonas_sp.AAC.1